MFNTDLLCYAVAVAPVIVTSVSPKGLPAHQLGATLTFTCTLLYGHSPVLLSWFTPSGSQFSIREITATLSNDEDFGVYRCRASNRYGVTFSEINVEKAGMGILLSSPEPTLRQNLGLVYTKL